MSSPSATTTKNLNEEENFDVEAEPSLIQWVKTIILNHGLVQSEQALNSQWNAKVEKIVSAFFVHDNEQYLFVTAYTEKITKKPNSDEEILITPDPEIKVFSRPSLLSSSKFDSILFFMKESNSQKYIHGDNVNESVSYGLVNGNPLDCLLEVMKNQFAPYLLSSYTAWPESIKKDFSSHLHKFLASLTETTYRSKGSTVLYVPVENIPQNIKEARKQKDLVQRLEVALMHWTTQIKEVVHETDSVEHSESSSPLSEIEYWRSRARDLMNIKQQIQRKDVRNIVDVLATSTYVKMFNQYCSEIQTGCDEALDNLKYLSALKDPCEKLATAEPKNIPKIIPEILQTIAMIWKTCKSYNSKKERLTGLLRKISNEVIARCRSIISLDDIFKGNVQSSMNALNESIYAGESWNTICTHTFAVWSQKLGASEVSQTFDYDESNVFAEISAFTQRCRDLLEVCEAQIQFGAGIGGDSTDSSSGLPIFGGTKGPEITKSLQLIKSSFSKHIAELSNVKYDILDVTKTNWLDDHGKFKNGVTDLGLIMVRIMGVAFDSVTTVETGVELLEAFSYLAKRDTIKSNVALKTGKVCSMFAQQLENIEKTFEMAKSNPGEIIYPGYPFYAGQAIYAYNILNRIQRDRKMVDAAHFLPKQREYEDMVTKYEQLRSTLEKFISTMYKLWYDSVPNGVTGLLDTAILMRVREGYLETNIDKTVLITLEEARYWSRLGFDLPPSMADLTTREEKLRNARENVNLVARDYNDIRLSLREDEFVLFKDRLYRLDSKINSGLTNIQWSSKGMIDVYVQENRKHCKETKTIIDDFKVNVIKIYDDCNEISNTELIKIEPKTVYTKGKFRSEQDVHISGIRTRLSLINNNIVQRMKHLYLYFVNDKEEIIKEWWKFVSKVEGAIYQALRNTVKRSLQKFSNSINGEKRSSSSSSSEVSVSPLFLSQVDLMEIDNELKPSLKPSIAELAEMVGEVSSKIVRSINNLPKLQEILEEEIKIMLEEIEEGKNESEKEEKKQRPKKKHADYYTDIKNDKEVKAVMTELQQGMKAIHEEVRKNLEEWKGKGQTGFENLMINNQAKEKQISRYMKQAEPEVFKSGIENNEKIEKDIKSRPEVQVVKYLQLEYGALKTRLASECNSWVQKLLTMSHQIASSTLLKIYQQFDKDTKYLNEELPTGQVEALSKKVSQLESLKAAMVETKKKYTFIADHYLLLEQYKFPVNEDEKEKLAKLVERGEEFERTMVKAKKYLDQTSERIKVKLKTDLEAFLKSITAFKSEFSTKAPYSSANVTVEQALDILRDFKSKLSAKRLEEKRLKTGFQHFNWDLQQCKEIRDIGKDIELLEKIWTLRNEWDGTWDAWKLGSFYELELETMESSIVAFLKKVNEIGREMREWHVWIDLKKRFQSFKLLLPLIQHLKNPAMRDRHWSDVKELVPTKFDQKNKHFTLEVVGKLGLENFENEISAISNRARAELMIENDIEKISKTWETLELDIQEYRSQYYTLKSIEDVSVALEENMTSLGSMKISPNIGHFQSVVSDWEKVLSKISETIDLLLTVQKQWMYLLNIFEVEDIQKQLPDETAIFKVVNSKWKLLMADVAAVRLAKKALQKEGLHHNLVDMNKKLETVQKHLDEYLEVKRQAFPRFYFLSDSDLLEILGQSKDPNAIQKHLENLFEGIYRLKITQTKDARQVGAAFQAVGMISKSTEYVPFNHPVPLEGAVEKWLNAIESAMRASIKRGLSKCYNELKRTNNREKWVVDWPGQLLITSSNILWTDYITSALSKVKTVKKNPLKELRKTWGEYLKTYTAMVRGDIQELVRTKLIALLTIEVHARDVIDRLFKMNCSSPDDFEWLKQLRFYEGQDGDGCFVRQTSAEIPYDFEYLGNTGRLVITPLTERCYMTLTTSLQLKYGGNPQGPAGTGKTESVKDLGKAIAKYVIVFNCSDSLDYTSLGRMFSGLVQTGAWSCFDEFNRIESDVLSVVAQQIFAIVSAISAGVKNFYFEKQYIPVNEKCGIFVTMNPGYAGRSELPDNLKALLRPVSMMVANAELICAIKLYSLGFEHADTLARKIASLYNLMSQQLSKQAHYDFGLRNITAVLTAAGALKRRSPKADEEVLLLTACKDMNLPKFVAEDVPLFNGIVGDLFQGVETPEKNHLGRLQQALTDAFKTNDLQPHKYLIEKGLQLYETMNTRHGVMVVGNTCSGKTVTWKALQHAMTKLNQEGAEGFFQVFDFPINPKAISNDEMYGNYDRSRDWKNGVLSVIMKDVCQDQKPDLKWIVFDGPVDTLWIESMNTLLDDNKILTLISGLRISLSPQVSLLFEVQDLAVASPATVSRCGMVFFDESELGWKPFVETWLLKRRRHDEKNGAPNPDGVNTLLHGLVTKFMEQALKAKETCEEVIQTSQLGLVRAFCNMFDAVATPENGLDVKEEESYNDIITKLFHFSLIWSIGATVTDDGRKKMDIQFRKFDPQFPEKHTVYEYFVDPKTRSWKLWDEKVNQTWKPPADTPFYKILVPTVDTIRNAFVISALMHSEKHVLVTGDVGTGKTVIVESILAQLDGSKYTTCKINFSARTSSNKLQEIIESKVEKKFDTFVPIAGKQLIVVADDFNMPQKDLFGSQPPLELLRQWLDYGFWYDREKQTKKNLRKMQLICAMGPPGGGRTTISARLVSRFSVINVTFPSDSQVKRIYGTLLKHRLQTMEEVKTLSEPVTTATLEIYKQIIAERKPIPSKSHYIFNLRDLSKVFQGIIQADHEAMDNKEQFLRLWTHECFRVFYDRLNDDEDRKWFKDKMNEKLINFFELKWQSLFQDSDKPTLFGDILSDGNYQELSDMAKLKSELQTELNNYNDVGKRKLNLVLFNYAIEHLCRVHRIIKQPRGHALLIGMGGSGRQSLTRLAANIAGYETFTIEITNNYRQREFRESLKELLLSAGIKQKKTVFLFTDTQIVEEGFLEDINTLLSTGEVPNLFDSDGLQQIYELVKKQAIADGTQDILDEVYKYFIERCKENVHIVLCMTPVPADIFRTRLRMFPALVSCTTIDWYSEWPQYALREVAKTFLEPLDVGQSINKDHIADIFVSIHASVVKISSKMMQEVRRPNYVTPTNYLELVYGYIDLLKEKKREITESYSKLEKGLQTLEDARIQVEKMSVELEQQKRDAMQKKKECEDLLGIIYQEKQVAEDKKQQVEVDKQNIEREKEKASRSQKEAESELTKALPQLEEAKAALETLEPRDISEIRGYQKIPKALLNVLNAIMTVLKKKPEEGEVKTALAAPQKFIEQLINYKKDDMNDVLLNKIKQYTSKTDVFDPDVVGKVSKAGKGLCKWVIAIENYGRINLKIKPKRAALEQAQVMLEKNIQRLTIAEAQLKELEDKLERLGKQYNEKNAELQRTNKIKEETELKLTRAASLVEKLGAERVRWSQSIEDYKVQLVNLPGDVLLASAFLSYAGPFDSHYRGILKSMWTKEVTHYKIPVSKEFTFQDFLASKTDVRDWTVQKLPSDTFSIENGALVTRSMRRWALMIDPQNQANQWIKNLEKERKLVVLDLKREDLLRTLELSIKFGQPVLIQDITEEIDPSLEPILSRAVYSSGGRSVIKVGANEVDFNPNFKLYLTTKLANPHYPPEISTKTTIVNFAVTKLGLEDQLLAIVVKQEKPELEQEKNRIVDTVAEAKKKMKKAEDEILKSLTSSTKKSILDDTELIEKLEESHANSQNIQKQLAVSQETEKKIDTARNQYMKAASRSSILYFVLTSLATVDPMYQFSLESYIQLFIQSIKNSDKPSRSDLIQQRVDMLNEFHTYEVYKHTCQALFEKHKLLFAFQMCIKIMEEQNRINKEEFYFFLRGGMVLDKENQSVNPTNFLPEQSWDNIHELDKLPNFHGIAQSFDESKSEWQEWYQHPTPETTPLPADWAAKGEGWNKMMVVRCVRQDRIGFVIKSFITSEMGDRFTKPPVNDIRLLYAHSNSKTPIIFVLSPGLDPADQLKALSKQENVELFSLSLGRGQDVVATDYIEKSKKKGDWVFLANCHLMTKWLPKLEEIVDKFSEDEPHEKFRLWLSSKPHDKFPITILQKSKKITTEPPQGIRANLYRLYANMTPSSFASCKKQVIIPYKRLLFSLAFFHSVLLERHKFGMLGWNTPYDFNDSDFTISEKILQHNLEKYLDATPWAALRYLIADVSYGGRVTDDMDRRLLDVYISQYFHENVLAEPEYKLANDTRYHIPKDGDYESYSKFIRDMESDDPPVAFGQHPNADISAQISKAGSLLDSLASLSPPQSGSTQSSEGAEKPADSKVYNLAYDLLENRIPNMIDKTVAQRADRTALNVVLLQEISRYNKLLSTIKSSLKELLKGIKGEVVMSAELEDIFNSLMAGKVPLKWQSAYASVKPLASWTRDLIQRVEQFRVWADGEMPATFNLGAFTFPSGFLTAVKQTTARAQMVSIDELTFEYTVIPVQQYYQRPKEGVFISGLTLEGAGWDFKGDCLAEPTPMELLCKMPVIHFKPVTAKKKTAKDLYQCPVYTYPVRQGSSYVMNIDLKSGAATPDHWIKRAVAIMLSTAD